MLAPRFFKYLLLYGFLLCAFRTIKGNGISALKQQLEASIIDTQRVNLYNSLAVAYLDSNFISALKYAKKANNLANTVNYEEGKIYSLRLLSDAYDYLGKYPEAQKVNFQLLEHYKKNYDLPSIHAININIGIINYYQSNYDQSIDYTSRALEYYKDIDDKTGVSICYNNLANVYADKFDLRSSLKYYFKALALDEQMNNLSGISLIEGNIGETYIELELLDSAELYLNHALQISDSLEDDWQSSNVLTALGNLYRKQKNYDKALTTLNRALEVCSRLSAIQEQSEIYEMIHKVYEDAGDFEASLNYLKKFNALNDSIYNKQSADKISEMNAIYDIKDKEQQLENQKAVAQFQQTQKVALIVGLVLLVIIVLILIKGNNSKRKTNKQLAHQKLLIETKNRDITDSIEYAKKIQRAILPDKQVLKERFKDSFVLYNPKDIVAGDFYWIIDLPDSTLIAVADCTGHGVPGAMVSVVCNNALNRAVRENGLTKPSEILDQVRLLVTETFEKSKSNIKDGMDIALCKFYKNSNKIEYAGANNPIWIIRSNDKNNEDLSEKLTLSTNSFGLYEVKANKQPVGKFINSGAFTNQELVLNPGDTVYLFTDGYADQFGGPKGKKFKYKALKNMLLDLQNENLENQKAVIYEHFNKWKGSLEQVDDVCIMGIRV